MGDLSPRRAHILRVDIGVATQVGRRAKNEDYVGVCLGRADSPGQKIVAAVADGLGGYKGGREASETAVRAFIDGFYNFPQLSVMRAASRSLDAINGWIATQRRVDPNLAGMATTFTALILAGRSGHVAHVGDTRAYRFSQGRLQQLTTDHTIDTGDVALALGRAVGFEAHVRVDHMAFALQAQDRFLLCSDGVHGVLNPSQLKALLASERRSRTAADAIVAAALKAGGADNISAIVVDVLDLPLVTERDLVRRLAALPIAAAPEPGEIIDNFRLDEIIADKPEVRVFNAVDLATGERVVLSFPHRCSAAAEAPRRSAFVNEAWAAARARSPWIGEIIEIDPARQTRLYSAAPFYGGETLERRSRRRPGIALPEGMRIATRLAQGVAHLHRRQIIHRDIRPENVLLLGDGGVRLVGLGRSRIPKLEFDSRAAPFGADEYSAPELLAGALEDESTDLYALGVTIYRLFCDAAPYDDCQRSPAPIFRRPKPLAALRPDLPAWLDNVLGAAFAPDRADRYGDVHEFALEIENGAHAAPPVRSKKALYDRNPVLFWQAICGVLFAVVILMMMRR
jgi:serine/threonine protein phosphatase PrpC